MTIKEIADIAQVSPETVRRVGKDLFPAKYENGKRTVFTQKESIVLMDTLRKKGFVQPTQSVEVPTQNAEVRSTLTKKDFEMIGAIVASVMANLDGRMTKIETKIEERQALLPAPSIKPRDNVSKIVREYAIKTGNPFAEVWGLLYREFGYRTNTSPKQCAKNRQMAVIDYIEAEGMMETLEAVAIDVLQ